MRKIDRLKQFMADNDLKQADLAREIGVTQQMVSRILANNENVPPSVELGLIKSRGFFLDAGAKKVNTKVVKVEKEYTVSKILEFLSEKYGYKKARVIEEILSM